MEIACTTRDRPNKELCVSYRDAPPIQRDDESDESKHGLLLGWEAAVPNT
jgi:hypothetical protein